MHSRARIYFISNHHRFYIFSLSILVPLAAEFLVYVLSSRMNLFLEQIKNCVTVWCDIYRQKSVQLLAKPVTFEGEVLKGFGRGGKLLGCPTANLDGEKLQETLLESSTGVYLGWAVGLYLYVYTYV